MKVNILGVQIDNFAKQEVLTQIEKFLTDGRQHYIVTPNPEIVMAAQKDKEFLEILNQADLAVPDGVGLIWASRYLKQPLTERVTGVDLMIDICQLAEQKNYSIFLLGGRDEAGEIAAKVLKKHFPRLRVAGAEDGGEISDNGLCKNYRLVERINNVKPDILFVAFGAGKQEKWITNNLQHLPSAKLALGVGGTFDFIAGKIKRAPKWVRKIWLEWLWRLFVQPWRWKRIFTATIKFSWRIITDGKKYVS